MKNKKYVNTTPLTETYESDGCVVRVFGEWNLDVLAKGFLDIYNKKAMYEKETES